MVTASGTTSVKHMVRSRIARLEPVMANTPASKAEMSAAQDTAQQIVTCILTGDRGTALKLASEYRYPDLLSLVMADLVAVVHHAWSTTTMSEEQVLPSWQALMGDIESFRADDQL